MGQERIPIPKAVGRRLVSFLESDWRSAVWALSSSIAWEVVSPELARSKAEELRQGGTTHRASLRPNSGGRVPPLRGRRDRCEVRRGRPSDDGAVCGLPARSKAAAGWGRIKIERELARRGVDATQLEGWPFGYLEEDESETAFALASRRRLSGKNDFQKLVRFLCGRGFPMGVAMDAAKRVLAEAEEG